MAEAAGGGGTAAPPSQAYLNEYSGDKLVVICITFAVLTTVTLGLRFWSKRFNNARIDLDDLLLVAAQVSYLALCTLGILAIPLGGVGWHVEAVVARNPALLSGWAKMVFAFQMVHFVTFTLPKIAIMVLYLHIFNWKGTMRVITLSMIALTAGIGLAYMTTSCLQCRPLAYWWNRKIPGGRCFDTELFFHTQAISSFVVDFAIMAMPVRTVWALKLPMHKKIALSMIFAVASCGVIASIFRAVAFFSTAALVDRTWASVSLLGWSVIESGVYIITACLPLLRPLISLCTPKWLKDLVKNSVTSVKQQSRPRSKGVRTEDFSSVISSVSTKEGQFRPFPSRLPPVEVRRSIHVTTEIVLDTRAITDVELGDRKQFL